MGREIIVHAGRCGSTLLFNVLDRYYRAKYNNDNTVGDLSSLSNREYLINGPGYMGLNEFMYSDFIDAELNEDVLKTKVKVIKGEQKRKIESQPVKNVYQALQQGNDDWEKRSKIFKEIKNKNLLMKYPLLMGSTTFDCDTYIHVERKDAEAQARSMYLCFTTGRYHVRSGDNKASRYTKFEPSSAVLAAWTGDLEKARAAYKKALSSYDNITTYYYEDFCDLDTHEILEMHNILDWKNYLEANFEISTGRVWT